MAAVIGAVILVAAGIWGFRTWQFSRVHEETDDAQLEGDISPVLPRVTGFVTRVLVQDNQRVAAGQALVEIDPAELDLKVSAAVAALSGAQSALETVRADLSNAEAAAAVAEAEVEIARVRQGKTASDLERDKRLFEGTAITDRQLSDSRAAADGAAAELQAAQRRAIAAKVQREVAATRLASASAQLDARKTDLDYARLQRSYATVIAPIAGTISRKSVEPGQLVQAGQTLMAVTADSGTWVVANFKETQLTRMKAGQAAEIEVDTYPGMLFHGRIDSIAGATGARFALLPPDNATGNFVKVTQRVPVKIVITDPADPLHPLRQGVSVYATVSIDGN